MIARGRANRRLVASFGLLLALCACHSDSLGAPCAKDADCGSGYDCDQNHCVRLCAADRECLQGQRCQRYRCVEAADTKRALPDATLIEVRALRREIELLRQEHQRILELLQPSKPTQPVPPKR